VKTRARGEKRRRRIRERGNCETCFLYYGGSTLSVW
jgi:hypothetical protein